MIDESFMGRILQDPYPFFLCLGLSARFCSSCRFIALSKMIKVNIETKGKKIGNEGITSPSAATGQPPSFTLQDGLFGNAQHDNDSASAQLALFPWTQSYYRYQA
ncbi:hypothetical protein NL676_015889 [Syzygium grande]|nr:hypothetical protein NL676_015889 [Syzygium grande]